METTTSSAAVTTTPKQTENCVKMHAIGININTHEHTYTEAKWQNEVRTWANVFAQRKNSTAAIATSKWKKQKMMRKRCERLMMRWQQLDYLLQWTISKRITTISNALLDSVSHELNFISSINLLFLRHFFDIFRFRICLFFVWIVTEKKSTIKYYLSASSSFSTH